MKKILLSIAMLLSFAIQEVKAQPATKVPQFGPYKYQFVVNRRVQTYVGFGFKLNVPISNRKFLLYTASRQPITVNSYGIATDRFGRRFFIGRTPLFDRAGRRVY